MSVLINPANQQSLFSAVDGNVWNAHFVPMASGSTESGERMGLTGEDAVDDVDCGTSSEPPTRKLIVGLGNPGREYESTRHNIGFWVLDELLRRHRVQRPEVEWGECCRAEFASMVVTQGDGEAIVDLAKPKTFMNRSGLSVRCLMEQFGYDVGHILVVFDDIALPLGTLRLRVRGSTAGHRGLASVIHQVRTEELCRLRLGIMPVEPLDVDLPDFVLAPFSEAEQALVETEVARAADCCESWVLDGATSAMNKYNGSVNESVESSQPSA